ncbi:MAG: ATP-binding protein, partial [Chloroflexota bacterium]
MDQRLELRVPATLEGVALAGERTEELLAAATVPGRAVHAVLVALEELLTNTVKYGYAGAPGQSIQLALRLTADAVELTLTDRARAFDPLAGPEPDLAAPVEQRDVGGLGLHLLRKLSREQRYAREDGQNVVTLVFDRQDPALALGPEAQLLLCPPQALIALMEEAFPGTNGCTIAFTFRLPGQLDGPEVERAFDRFVEAQEAMRLRVRGGAQ